MIETRGDKFSRYLGERAERDEWGLLASVCREGAWLMADLQSAGVSTETFLDIRAGFAWGAVAQHVASGAPLSPEAIAATLDEQLAIALKRSLKNPDFKPAYLGLTGERVADLLFWEPLYTTDAQSALFLGKRLVSGWQFRKAERELRGILSEAASWQGTPESFVEEAQRRVLSLPTVADSGRSVKNVGDHLHAYLDRMWAEYESGDACGGIKTGFDRLDSITNGMMPGDLVILAAESGVGKTSFAINAAASAMRAGKRVLFFSLEMILDEILGRLVWLSAQVSSKDYRQRRMTAEDWDKISKASAAMCAQNMDVLDDASVTLPRLHAIARQVAFTKGVDLIVVDYAQLLQGSDQQRGQRNREQEVREIADGLKRLASDLRVPVMALSQVNDDGKLRESRSLKFNASHVWMLSVSSCQDGLGDTSKTKRYELLVEKGRNSATGGKIRMLYFPEQTRLEEEFEEVGDGPW